MLSDVLPTGFECGVLNGQVSPGDTVAIVGAGPIGLAVLLTAQLYSPAAVIVIDHDQKRLEIARQFGATDIVNSSDGHAVKRVLASTAGAGADVVVESVGFAATFDMCQGVVATGGRIANVGVHGAPVWLRLDRLWDRNITLTTRLVDSLSKQSNLAGYRAGFVAGCSDLIGELLEARKHAGLMPPAPVQHAMIAALGDDQHVAEQRERYRARRARWTRG